VLTSDEVQAVLRKRGWESRYPFFTTVNGIVRGELPPEALVQWNAPREVQLLAGIEAASPLKSTAGAGKA
jgi:glycerol-3-phosphate dehydrogenase (NAD+)